MGCPSSVTKVQMVEVGHEGVKTSPSGRRSTSTQPEGRISPQDLGIWKDDHIEPLARIVRFIHQQGSIAGTQLAHAGRKASTYRPWQGHGTVPESDGGWTNVVAASALAFLPITIQCRKRSPSTVFITLFPLSPPRQVAPAKQASV